MPEYMMKRTKIAAIVFLLLVAIFACIFVCRNKTSKIHINALILPKFEIDELTGDSPGEAQLFYEHYFSNPTVIEIKGCDVPIYVEGDKALMVIGEGKVSAAANLSALLADGRFDFDNAYIYSVGCCGSPTQDTVMGDVFIITAAIDGDLGHTADFRDMMSDDDATTWFFDAEFEPYSYYRLDEELVDKCYELAQNAKIETTEKTRQHMRKAFNNADWAVRDPMLIKGSTISSDNYWKGIYSEANARLMNSVYDCPEPFVSTEMEDVAIARVAKNYNMLDRLVGIRVSVDMDVFTLDTSPESSWGGEASGSIVDDESETSDIFETAMYNLFNVSSAIIDNLQ